MNTFIKILLAINLTMWIFIESSKLEFQLLRKYGVVKNSEGKVYRFQDYGGYGAAMRACLRSSVIDGPATYAQGGVVCGPHWK